MESLTATQLQSMQLFSTLTIDQCSQLLDRHYFSKYEAEQVFLMEQDWGETIFILQSGLAKVRTYTADGVEVVMSLLGEGDVFGEIAALDSSARSADVVALTKGHLLKLRSGPFLSLLKKEASFALDLFKLESSRLRDLNQRFAIQTSDATTRILNTLSYLARKSSSENDPKSPIPNLPQSEIGLISGLSRETTSRVLNKLKKRKVIDDIDGFMHLVDLDPLVKRSLL
tara:strand:+ start:56 stop:739 length:684 start_codon:yes stop_codon:yes gene_type:complete